MKLSFFILPDHHFWNVLFRRFRVFALIFSFFFIGNIAVEAQIYQYTLNTGGAYSMVDLNATATGLSRVNGANAAASLCAQGFSSRGFPNAAAFNSAAGAIQFTITPNFGYQLTIQTINAIDGYDTGTNGPLSFRFAYSLDGSTWVSSPTNYGCTAAGPGTCTSFTGVDTWDMADFSSNTIVYFRIYPNSTVGAGGATNGVHYVRNINVTGTVVPVTIPGCTNSGACNYNPIANFDNGTCSMPGCLDNTACNYSPTAMCQGSVVCTYPSCLDPTACNYNICPGGACQYIGGACDDGNAGTGPDTWQSGCICTGPPLGSPFNGIAVKEVAIPAPQLALIDAQLTDPAVSHCYRVFVCFNDPLWELQAMYSDPLLNQNWTLTSTTSTTNKFYRHPVANVMLGTQVNPILFGPFPELQYDSWLTFKSTNSTGAPSLLVVQSGPGPLVSTPPLPLSTWDSSAGNLDINPVSSYAGCAITNVTTYPTATGMPNGQSQVLIGQFTTDGTLTGNFNIQFRKMANAGGTVYSPTTTIQQPTIQFLAPAADTLCHMVLLPIELLSFNAEIVVEDRVDLVWVTQSEINNELFIIERSPDGIDDWIAVNQMPGGGTTQEQIYYRSFDFHPLEGLNFYRLKQIDTNGEYSYSPIEVIEFHHAGNIQVWPNPSDGTVLRLGGDTFGLERFIVRSVDGKIVAHQKFASPDAREIQLEQFNLSQGMYSLELYKKDKGHPQVVKVIIE